MKFRNVNIKRLILVIVSVIIMGFALSFLNLTDFGTDPCTVFNLGVSEKLGMTLGNWQAIFNCMLLIVVIIFGRDQIGWGSIANMFLVGYSFDFFSWLNSMWMPENFMASMAVRVLVAVPALAIFVFAASTYIACDLGTSPYDAIPNIVSARLKNIPFKFVRICYDILVGLAGFLLGSTVGAVTFIMAFTLGPVITWIKENIIEKYLI